MNSTCSLGDASVRAASNFITWLSELANDVPSRVFLQSTGKVMTNSS